MNHTCALASTWQAAARLEAAAAASARLGEQFAEAERRNGRLADEKAEMATQAHLGEYLGEYLGAPPRAPRSSRPISANISARLPRPRVAPIFPRHPAEGEDWSRRGESASDGARVF